ncbi:hypothetical protein RJ639_044436 [Escallonia herrerae]|uniref:Retrotransposon gag domain-containing protein n=1 Tax=Escallonia herrerae TaxID=1293975 RepID=A0AA88WIU7_9ASTE|nr:hypothetical protein RJ639_044436 [Escallonia herrerae]
MPVTIRWEDEFWHIAEHGEELERCDRGYRSTHEERARGIWRALPADCRKLDDLKIDSRLAVLEREVDLFAEELDDLIEERVAHFTKREVQRCKDLEGQVTELQEELATYKRKLTRVYEAGVYRGTAKAKENAGAEIVRWNERGKLERYFKALNIDKEEKVQRTVVSQVEPIFNRLDDLEVDSRLTVLEWKVDVFAKELDDLIEERVAHFTKREVQRRKDLKGQVAELQEELAACKRELTRATRQGCIAVQPRRKKIPKPRSYDRAREERYFEALDIDEEEKMQTTVMYPTDTTASWWRHHYTDGCDVKTWEKFKRELKRQFYPESVKDMAMINLRRLSRRGASQWVATELRWREPHDLDFAMAIVERLQDFKQCERSRSPRHERAKGGGDGRLKSGSPKATDDERNGDEGRRRHHKREKKHEGSRKQGDSHDYKAHGGPRGGCFYCADPHYRKDCPHKGKMIVFKNHKGSKGDSFSNDGEARVGALQMVNMKKPPKGKKSKNRYGLLYATVDIVGKTQEVLVDTEAIHNFMSPRVAKWLRLKPTKDGSWFTAVNTKERPTKAIVKNADLRIGGWTGKADLNIIGMDELGVVLGMDFMENSSATLNPYCGLMMMAGKDYCVTAGQRIDAMLRFYVHNAYVSKMELIAGILS